MEARAAVACLGAHRRSPEAGERTLVSIEDSTTGHLFPAPSLLTYTVYINIYWWQQPARSRRSVLPDAVYCEEMSA